METIHLIGAEDVKRAGSRISDAASRIEMAASSFESTVDMALRRFEDLIDRAEAVARSVERLADSTDDFRNEMIARFGDECSVAYCIQLGPASTHIHADMVQKAPCPGCIDCGPPIVVKAEDRCGKATPHPTSHAENPDDRPGQGS